MSLFGVILVRFSHLRTEYGEISLRIQCECGKTRTRITPITDTFHAVKSIRCMIFSRTIPRKIFGNFWTISISFPIIFKIAHTADYFPDNFQNSTYSRLFPDNFQNSTYSRFILFWSFFISFHPSKNITNKLINSSLTQCFKCNVNGSQSYLPKDSHFINLVHNP